MTLVASLLACVAGEGGGPRLDAPIAIAHVGPGDQHHATVALRPDGRGLVTFVSEGARWLVAVPVVDGVPGPRALPFEDHPGHHPQVFVSGDGFGVVAVAAGGAGLLLADLDLTGAGEISFAATSQEPQQPDVVPGWILAGGQGELMTWTFEDVLAPTEAPPVPLAEQASATPSVRATRDGWVAAWTERSPDRVTLNRGVFHGDGVDTEVLEAWDEFDDSARASLVVGPAGEAVAWRRESLGTSWIRFLDADGAAVDEIELDGGRPMLSAVGDVVLAAWERPSGDRWTVALQAFDLATGAPIGPEREVDPDAGHPARPAVAAVPAEGGLRALVSWEALAEPGRREVRIRSLRW